MIKSGKTEKEYRAIPKDSSSSIKIFAEDKKKYYKKFILGEPVEDTDDSYAVKMGKIVECLLFEKELFDEKFLFSTCSKTPTGKMMDFINNLYVLTIKYPSNTFLETSEEAHKITGWSWGYDKVMENFSKGGSESAEAYYDELLATKRDNKVLVVANDVAKAETIVEQLKNNPIISEILKAPGINQFQMEEFILYGLPMKGMIDRLVIDEKNKLLSIYDLKCTWSVEGFYKEYYLRRKAYIQAFTYWMGVQELTQTEGHPWYGWDVEFPMFIVCDSTGFYEPLIYTTNNESMKKANDGFIDGGREYPGVQGVIEDLKWARETGKWNISRTNFLNNNSIVI